MSELKNVLAALSEFGSTFDKLNDNPNVTPVLKTAGDDVSGSLPALRKVLSIEDRILMQRSLSALDSNEITALLYKQMAKPGMGVPIGHDPMLANALGADPVISKVLDTTGGAALQRQDLEPMLWTLNEWGFAG